MRVLMVSDVYFPRVNGVSTSIETFRRTLAEQGVEVRLVVPRYGDEGHEGGVVRVAGRSVPGDREDRLLAWGEMHRAVLESARDCDLIHIQTPFVAHYAGLKAARTLGLPVIATYHTLFEEYLQHYARFIPAGWLRGQARRFSRRQCNDLDAVVVPSSAMRQRLASYGVTTPMTVLPTGIPCRYVSHDLFGSGDQYLKDDGKWLYLPASTPETFTGYNFWLSNSGQRLWIALYFGQQQPQALLFEGTLLQLVLPPEGIKTPEFAEPMRLPLTDVVGVWAAERIDTVLSDDRSQAYIRVFAETERKPSSKPDEPETVSEWLRLELGVPALSHNLTINPTGNHFSAMFSF